MDLTSVIQALYGNQQVFYLVILVAANVLLGIASALYQGQFRLTNVGTWTTERVVPLSLGYGACALLALANPQLGLLRDAAFAFIAATLLGHILANLQELGIPLPTSLAGKDLTAFFLTSRPRATDQDAGQIGLKAVAAPSVPSLPKGAT